MTRYVLSLRAQRDFDQIWNYTTAQWSAAQAETYIRQIQAAIETVASNPAHGKSCDDIRPGYFRLIVASHILFYRMTGDVLDVVRILHVRMDIDSQL